MSEDKVTSADFLSQEEKEKIQAQVKKELDAENLKKIKDDYKAQLISEAKTAARKALLKDAKEGEDENGLVPVFIDLPLVSECIRLDGVAYYPGRTYNVTVAVREIMLEIMGRGQSHENEISGKTAKEKAEQNRRYLKNKI
jgi:hypothetical protein